MVAAAEGRAAGAGALRAAVEPRPAAAAAAGAQLDLDVYVKEASRDHRSPALEAQCARNGEFRCRRARRRSHEFMRAAHTLASSSRTAGFDEIADLAGRGRAMDAVRARRRRAGRRAGAAGGDRQAARDGRRGCAAKRRSPPPPKRAGWASADGAPRRRAPPPIEVPQQPRMVGGRRRQTRLLRPCPSAEAANEASEAAGRAKRVMRDDIDPQLLPIFLEEAQELLPQLGSDLRDWKANPGGREGVAVAAARSAHIQGQRADGGRDPAGRAHAPHGEPHRGGDRGERSSRRSCSTSWNPRWTA